MATEKSEAALARRLLVAVVTPVGLLVVVGVLLALQILRMSDTERWVEHTDEAIAATNDLQKQIIDQETGLRGFIMTGDRSFLEPYDRARPLDVFASLRALVAENPTQQARVDEVRRSYDAWAVMAVPPLDSVGALEPFRSLASMNARKDRMDSVREAIADLLTNEHELLDERRVTARDATRTTFFAGVPVFAGLAAALAFASRRQLNGVAHAYGAALNAEREAKEAIEAKDWVGGAHVTLSERIQGDLSVDDVARRAIDTMVKLVEAEVGAFYAREPAGLRRRAGHAIDPSRGVVFERGEGLVGQTAVDQSLLHLRDVPGDFLKIRSGSGEREPVEVVLVPAVVDGDTHGVVELGFLHPVSARALELLTRVGETVATAVRSAEHKARLRELLEESQQQAEELETQQEELRVANRDLHQHGDALRSAQAQLEERNEELEASNASLAGQRDALERAQSALAEKAAEVARASQYKSEFLANMSHELRTPLNSTLILAKLLIDNEQGNLTEEQVKFAQTIYSGGIDLLALINDVLDLSKVEAGKLAVETAPIALHLLVEPATRAFEQIAATKHIVFSATLAEPEATIDTDAQRVQQVLKNLLSNAFKFTERGEVSLQVDRSGEGFTFIVSDTGIGIPLSQRQAIFEAFRQADGTTHRKFGGTGLGLSISRDLARLLGGDLRVESEVGKGSRFILELPRSFAAPRPHGAPLGTQESSRPPVRRRINGSSGRARSIPTAALLDDRELLDGKRRVLLIIEDDLPFAEILGTLAREQEFQYLVAHEAEEGIRLAIDFHPDAIVLDMNLPDHSGLLVLDRLKRGVETRHIPIHVISVADHTRAALSMGAVGYLKKPVDREQLVAVLRGLKERFTAVRRLLVVEDDTVQREAVCRLFEASDVETVAVSSIAGALEHLAAGTFDCVITDLMLADGSGFDLLERMARDEAYSFPPVVVYTARSLTGDEEQQLQRYANSIIVKGAQSPERLLDEVTLFLHQVESELPLERQRMLRESRDREAMFDGRKILVAEDDVRNIFALGSALEAKGAHLVIARNGREALEKLDEVPEIDLVLMDVMMPEMDGLRATAEIRKRGSRFAKLPIIAMTAKAMRDDQERCMRAGANDYIAKPFELDMLLSLVRVWMPR